MIPSWPCPDPYLTRRVVVVAVGVSALCISLISVWKWTRDEKMPHNSSSKERKNKDLDDKEAKLKEELKKTDEKLDNLVYKVTTYMNLLKILENQRELFRLQLEDMERDKEDNREKIQAVERLITESETERATDRTEEHLREKQRLLNAQWKLERRKEELKKLQLNTQKQLQREEGQGNFNRLRERKTNLEIYKGQLHEQLQGTETVG